ncbi:hypothetical protein [Burkholderia ubonensis]|uniref:hypothetical protein n=1 Tax=Burkholderia ubonensis TaxID=101571 RepID=UPI000AB253C0|nr:hypothetical protein [Burkholderia ubonensis]
MLISIFTIDAVATDVEDAAADIVVSVNAGEVFAAFVPEILRSHVVTYAGISDDVARVLAAFHTYSPGLDLSELALLATIFCWPSRVTGLIDHKKRELEEETRIAQEFWRELKDIDDLIDFDLESIGEFVYRIKKFIDRFSGQFSSNLRAGLANFSNILSCEKTLYRSIDGRRRSDLLSSGQRADYVEMELLKSPFNQFSNLEKVTGSSALLSVIRQRLEFLRHGRTVAREVLHDIQCSMEPRIFPFLSILMLRGAERYAIAMPEVALVLAVRALELYCVGILVADGFSIAKDGRLSKGGNCLSGAGAVWAVARQAVEKERRIELDAIRKQKLQIWLDISWEVDCILDTRNQSIFGHGIIRTSQLIAEDAIAVVMKLINAREGSRAATVSEYQSLRKWSAHSLKTVLRDVIMTHLDFLTQYRLLKDGM